MVDKLDEVPADFSDDDDAADQASMAINKQALLEWVTYADFAKEISLVKISNHKFKLEPEEIDAHIGNVGMLKIIKV